MLNIKVLGPGCPNCAKVEAVARKAAAKAGVEAQFEKVTDFSEIMNYNVLSTPGLVINEQLVSAGRIPRESEITAWLARAMAASG